MPKDPLYVPIRVGAEGKEDMFGYTPDNTGENISHKNRRHFTMLNGTNDRRDVLSLDQARSLFSDIGVVLPTKRNYWIETNYQQYVHAHHAEDLDETRKILEERYPGYIPAYDSCMKKTTGHRFNMFIMKKEIADQYCAWLFDVLFELEERLDISTYSVNDKRVFGFVSERLLDVWLETNQIKYKDIPYIFLEKQNWITKGINFILRKMNRKELRR